MRVFYGIENLVYCGKLSSWKMAINTNNEERLIMLDMQEIFNSILFAGLAAVGWFAKTMWNAIKELTADLSRLRENLPTVYVPKDDWKEGVNQINANLDRIFEKLDNKLDK